MQEVKSSTAIPRPTLSKWTRWCIWVCFWFILLNTGMSSGIMSPASKYIKAQLGMMDWEYGCFSAMYAIGRLTGALLFVSIINVVNRKYMLILGALLKAVTVMAFYFVNDGYALLSIRMISGIGHIIPVIYGPIWVDQLCIQKWRYIMMTGFSICGPTGRSIGYILNYIFGAEKWRVCFFFNGLVIAIAALLILPYPAIYFSSKLIAMKGKEGEDVLRKSEAKVVSVFNVRYSEVNERDINVFKKYSSIFKNPVYIFSLLARVVILSINAVLQFWMPNYLTEVLGHEDKFKNLCCYVFMISCLPTMGSFCGSYATKSVGGYENKHSLVIVLIFNLFACLWFAPATYVNSWYSFLACAGCFQFCGSAVLPSLNGIILSSIPGVMKSKGYAIANIMSAFFGSVPSPIFYGLLNDKMKKYDKRFCMKYFTWYAFAGLFWIIIATIFRYRQEENKEKKEPFKQAEKGSDGNIGATSPNALIDIDIPMTTWKPGEEDVEEGTQLADK